MFSLMYALTKFISNVLANCESINIIFIEILLAYCTKGNSFHHLSSLWRERGVLAALMLPETNGVGCVIESYSSEGLVCQFSCHIF